MSLLIVQVLLILKVLKKVQLIFGKKIIDVNLTGIFISCKLIAPSMKKNKKGSIINVSSRAAKFGGLDETAYCASKIWG